MADIYIGLICLLHEFRLYRYYYVVILCIPEASINVQMIYLRTIDVSYAVHRNWWIYRIFNPFWPKEGLNIWRPMREIVQRGHRKSTIMHTLSQNSILTSAESSPIKASGNSTLICWTYLLPIHLILKQFCLWQWGPPNFNLEIMSIKALEIK